MDMHLVAALIALGGVLDDQARPVDAVVGFAVDLGFVRCRAAPGEAGFGERPMDLLDPLG